MDRNYKIIFEALLTILILIGLLFLVLESIGFVLGIRSSFIYNFGFFDLIIGLLILVDFVIFRIVIRGSQNIWNVFKENWFFIIAGIPLFFICFNLLQLYQYEIIIGLIGIIRIYAIIKVLLITSREVRRYPKKTKLDYATLVLLLVLIIGSAVFFIVEKAVNPEVPNYESAIWYALVSMTTTGYGDIVPVTTLGHVIGIIFIFTGMGYVSLTTATLAYSFIDLFRKESQKATQKANIKFEKTSEGLKDSLETHDAKMDQVLKRMDEIEKKLDKKEE